MKQPLPPCDIAAIRQIELYAPHLLTAHDRAMLRAHTAADTVHRARWPLLVACIAALASLPVIFAAATPCPTEDSANCYWNAAAQGNGTGAGFLDVGGMIIWQGAAE